MRSSLLRDFLLLSFTFAAVSASPVALAKDKKKSHASHEGSKGFDFKLKSLKVTAADSEAGGEDLAVLDEDTLLTRLQNVEQICVAPGNSRIRDYSQERISRIGAELSRRLKDAGFETVDAPRPHWDLKTWDGEKAWLDALERRSPEDRCRLVSLAYGTAVYRVSTLSTPVQPKHLSEIRYNESDFKTPKEKETLAKIERDIERASWEFRYFQSPRVRELAKECSALLSEARARNDFILHSHRRPLGYAIGMCGRPMNAHYIDDKFPGDIKDAPEGWEFPTTEVEVDRIEVENTGAIRVKADIDVVPKKDEATTQKSQ